MAEPSCLEVSMQQCSSVQQHNVHAEGWSLDLLAEHEHRNVHKDASKMVAYIPREADLVVLRTTECCTTCLPHHQPAFTGTD